MYEVQFETSHSRSVALPNIGWQTKYDLNEISSSIPVEGH